MAHIATNQTFVAPAPSLLSRLGNFFVAYTETRSRRDEVEALEALSDAELAERGLTRDRIVRHVFADLLYV